MAPRQRLDVALTVDRLNTALYQASPASWADWQARLEALDGTVDLAVDRLSHDILRGHYWNVVAVYLIALRPPPPVAAALLLLLAVLVFVPIRYVYPSRTVTLRPLTVLFGALWAIAFLTLIWLLPAPPAWLVWVSSIYPVYYVALSLWLTARR